MKHKLISLFRLMVLEWRLWRLKYRGIENKPRVNLFFLLEMELTFGELYEDEIKYAELSSARFHHHDIRQLLKRLTEFVDDIHYGRKPRTYSYGAAEDEVVLWFDGDTLRNVMKEIRRLKLITRDKKLSVREDRILYQITTDMYTLLKVLILRGLK